MSFIGRRVGNARLVVLTGLVYTLGRMVAYVSLGTLLVAGVLSIPQLSQALQQGMAKLLGPLLVVIGMVLFELLTVPTGNLPFAEGLRKRAESWGLLGFIFALSFCPVSAALFFGSLVPLAVRCGGTSWNGRSSPLGSRRPRLTKAPGCTWSGTGRTPFASRISSRALTSPSEWSK